MPLPGPSTPVVTLTNMLIPAYRVENRRLMIMSSGTHLQDQVRTTKCQVPLPASRSPSRPPEKSILRGPHLVWGTLDRRIFSIDGAEQPERM